MGRLIDAHIHFWDPGARRHKWLDAVPELNRPFGPSDIEFGSSTPDGCVFVEADCEPDEALSEVQWVSSLPPGGVPVLGIVAHAPLHEGTKVEAFLRRLRLETLVVGVRRLLQDEPFALVESAELAEGTRLLEAHGLTSDLCVTWEQLPAVTRLVRACPGTSFVLDHLAKPPVGEGVPDRWRDDLRRLADCPNVACKLSGLATIAPPGWRGADVLPYLSEALEAFGPERCMFGSDWPVALLNSSYEGWLEAVVEAIRGLGASERDAVLGENAIRIYGLTDPSDTRRAHADS